MAYSYILVLAILFLSVLDCESCKDKNDPKLLKWKGKHPKFQFTISGKECQKWSEDKPHKKGFSPEDKNHNYCRNPDKDYSGLWCYTTDPETRWERCHQPPPCDDCKTKDDPKLLKFKKESPIYKKTKSGKECQMWSVDKPHKRVYSPEEKENNYCQNPDTKYAGGLWCYTTDPGKRWEKCVQPPPCDGPARPDQEAKATKE